MHSLSTWCALLGVTHLAGEAIAMHPGGVQEQDFAAARLNWLKRTHDVRFQRQAGDGGSSGLRQSGQEVIDHGGTIPRTRSQDLQDSQDLEASNYREEDDEALDESDKLHSRLQNLPKPMERDSSTSTDYRSHGSHRHEHSKTPGGKKSSSQRDSSDVSSKVTSGNSIIFPDKISKDDEMGKSPRPDHSDHNALPRRPQHESILNRLPRPNLQKLLPGLESREDSPRVAAGDDSYGRTRPQPRSGNEQQEEMPSTQSHDGARPGISSWDMHPIQVGSKVLSRSMLQGARPRALEGLSKEDSRDLLDPPNPLLGSLSHPHLHSPSQSQSQSQSEDSYDVLQNLPIPHFARDSESPFLASRQGESRRFSQ